MLPILALVLPSYLMPQHAALAQDRGETDPNGLPAI